MNTLDSSSLTHGAEVPGTAAPAMAAQKISNSPEPGMCGKIRYFEYTELPVT